MLRWAEPPSPPPLPLDLNWNAPASCPTRSAVAEEIARIVGRPLIFDAEADVGVSGTITQTAQGFVLVFETRVRGAVELRTMASEQCGALLDATGLVVAVALEPFVAAPATDSARSEEALESGVPLPPSNPSPASPRRARREPVIPVVPPPPISIRGEPAGPAIVPSGRPKFRSGYSAIVLLVLAGPAWTQSAPTTALIGGGVGWVTRRIRIALSFDYLARRRTSVGENLELRIAGADGALRGFWIPSRGRWQFPLGGGLDVGARWGRASGPTVVGRSSMAPNVAVVVSGGLQVEVTRWLSLGIRADLVGTVVRPLFFVGAGAEAQDFYAPGFFAGRLVWMTEFRIPLRDGSARVAVH